MPRGPRPHDDHQLVERALWLVLLRGLGHWTATKAAVAEARVQPHLQDAAVQRIYRKLVAELHRIQREGRTSSQLDLEAYDARLAAFQTAFPEGWAAIAAEGTPVDLDAAYAVVNWLLTNGRWRDLLPLTPT
jgi:hypothetical protein